MVCDRTANTEEGSTESVMAGDAVVLCSDILDMATVCDHGCMSPEWKEQREKSKENRKKGALEPVSGISRTFRMATQSNPVQSMYYFHKSRSCAAVLCGKYEVRFGRILDGGTSLEGRHNPFFFWFIMSSIGWSTVIQLLLS